MSQYLPDLPYIALLQNSLSLHLAVLSFLTPILFSCGIIPDIIRTCANGVAEGFALQVFAEMPTGQGRVGLFLLFSFNLEVLD